MIATQNLLSFALLASSYVSASYSHPLDSDYESSSQVSAFDSMSYNSEVDIFCKEEKSCMPDFVEYKKRKPRRMVCKKIGTLPRFNLCIENGPIKCLSHILFCCKKIHDEKTVICHEFCSLATCLGPIPLKDARGIFATRNVDAVNRFIRRADCSPLSGDGQLLTYFYNFDVNLGLAPIVSALSSPNFVGGEGATFSVEYVSWFLEEYRVFLKKLLEKGNGSCGAGVTYDDALLYRFVSMHTGRTTEGKPILNPKECDECCVLDPKDAEVAFNAILTDSISSDFTLAFILTLCNEIDFLCGCTENKSGKYTVEQNYIELLKNCLFATYNAILINTQRKETAIKRFTFATFADVPTVCEDTDSPGIQYVLEIFVKMPSHAASNEMIAKYLQ